MHKVQFTSANGARNNVAHLSIVLTDGVPNPPNSPAAAAKLARNDAIRLIPIGITDDVDTDQVRIYSVYSVY